MKRAIVKVAAWLRAEIMLAAVDRDFTNIPTIVKAAVSAKSEISKATATFLVQRRLLIRKATTTFVLISRHWARVNFGRR